MLCFFFMSFKKKSNQVENSEEFKSFHHFFELVLLSCGYVLHGFCFGILFCSRIATCSLWFSQLLFSTLVYSWLLILLGKCLKYIAELDPINIWKAGHPWREREDWNLQSSSHPFWEGGGAEPWEEYRPHPSKATGQSEVKEAGVCMYSFPGRWTSEPQLSEWGDTTSRRKKK